MECYKVHVKDEFLDYIVYVMAISLHDALRIASYKHLGLHRVPAGPESIIAIEHLGPGLIEGTSILEAKK